MLQLKIQLTSQKWRAYKLSENTYKTETIIVDHTVNDTKRKKPYEQSLTSFDDKTKIKHVSIKNDPNSPI